MIETVRIFERFQDDSHVVVILGRPHPGAPRSWLKADGTWEPLAEDAGVNVNVDVYDYGIVFPEGALDALVNAHVGAAAPAPATERHLTDAIAVRDRVLELLDRELAP